MKKEPRMEVVERKSFKAKSILRARPGALMGAGLLKG